MPSSGKCSGYSPSKPKTFRHSSMISWHPDCAIKSKVGITPVGATLSGSQPKSQARWSASSTASCAGAGPNLSSFSKRWATPALRSASSTCSRMDQSISPFTGLPEFCLIIASMQHAVHTGTCCHEANADDNRRTKYGLSSISCHLLDSTEVTTHVARPASSSDQARRREASADPMAFAAAWMHAGPRSLVPSFSSKGASSSWGRATLQLSSARIAKRGQGFSWKCRLVRASRVKSTTVKGAARASKQGTALKEEHPHPDPRTGVVFPVRRF
mmetsp:Transcript_22952/g.54222  ORF Transcript_22952/g.54222 Transcript_22952/m.54222 type:complete len:272 (-) Transcript_22952:62-877(-)